MDKHNSFISNRCEVLIEGKYISCFPVIISKKDGRSIFFLSFIFSQLLPWGNGNRYMPRYIEHWTTIWKQRGYRDLQCRGKVETEDQHLIRRCIFEILKSNETVKPESNNNNNRGHHSNKIVKKFTNYAPCWIHSHPMAHENRSE